MRLELLTSNYVEAGPTTDVKTHTYRFDGESEQCSYLKQQPRSRGLSDNTPVGLRAPNLQLWVSLESSESKTLLGDAEAPGIIQSAVFAGHKAARKFLNDGVEPAMKRERGMLFVS